MLLRVHRILVLSVSSTWLFCLLANSTITRPPCTSPNFFIVPCSDVVRANVVSSVLRDNVKRLFFLEPVMSLVAEERLEGTLACNVIAQLLKPCGRVHWRKIHIPARSQQQSKNHKLGTGQHQSGSESFRMRFGSRGLEFTGLARRERGCNVQISITCAKAYSPS